MSLRRLEWTWSAEHFFDELILIYPTYAVLMTDRGVGAIELSILFVIWSASVVLFEVPSGVIGDLVPRNRLVAAGSVVKAMGFGLWWLWPSFWGFALGFVLWSLGSAARSGAAEALLHDSLDRLGETDQFERVYGRGLAASGVGTVIALAVGGMLSESGYGWPLALSVLSPLIAAALMLLVVKEPPRASQNEGFVSTLRSGLWEVLRDRRMLVLVGMFALLATGPGVLEEYDGPLLVDDLGMSLTQVGLWTAVVWLARTVGVYFAHRLRGIGVLGVGALFVLGNLLLLPIFVGTSTAVVVALAGYQTVCGAAEVLAQGAMQRRIESGARATVTSIAGAGAEVWSIVLFLVVGFGATQLGWSAAYLGVGVLGAVIAGVLSVLALGAWRADR